MEARKDTYAIKNPESSMRSTMLASADGSTRKSHKQKKAALQVMPSEDLYVFSGSLEKKVDLCQSFGERVKSFNSILVCFMISTVHLATGNRRNW